MIRRPGGAGAFAVELLSLFLNPLVIILLVASVVSAILGQKVDVGIIVLLVLLGININFVQTYRSQRAMERLRQHASLTATVLQDSEWQELKRQLIVPGDIVRLSAGDLVPADAQLLESRDSTFSRRLSRRVDASRKRGAKQLRRIHSRRSEHGVPRNICG
jgi:Mg2+-importing ATPase